MLDVVAKFRFLLTNLFAVIFSLASMLVSSGCSSPPSMADRNTITVLAAASLVESMDQVARAFEAAHSDISVNVGCGPSNALAMQILAGAPADVFVSASSLWSDELDEKLPGAMTAPLLRNQLVLVVPSGNSANVQSLADLISPNVESIALAGENVPLGMYATQALMTEGSFDTLKRSGKIIRASDARATVAYVVRGEVDAGIVYATDAGNEPRVTKVAEFDPNDYDPIVYSAVLLPTSKASKTQVFFQFLFSDQARQIFEESGFAWNADSQTLQ